MSFKRLKGRLVIKGPSEERARTLSVFASKRGAGLLLKMILSDLKQRWSTLVVSSEAIAQFPSLGNLERVLKSYIQCFRIEETDSGARVVLDREQLVSLGLPSALPELLEYGSEVGISPVVHLRTAWQRFKSGVETLAR